MEDAFDVSSFESASVKKIRTSAGLVMGSCMCTGTGEKKSKRKLYKNSLDCLASIYKWEGLLGVNRGMVTTLIRETPCFGVYFLTYDFLTRSIGCEPGEPYMIPKLLFAGGMSGVTCWLSTYPVDVIKSRLQADGMGGVYQYSSIADCVRQSVRREGLRVFTRGLTSTLLRAFPVNAVTFATVTLVLMYARGWRRGPRNVNRRPPAQLTTHSYSSRPKPPACDLSLEVLLPPELLYGGVGEGGKPIGDQCPLNL